MSLVFHCHHYLYKDVVQKAQYVVLCSAYSYQPHDLFSMDDGLLLKPTRPAMSLDSTFLLRTFGKGGPNGHLWAGYTMYDHSQV